MILYPSQICYIALLGERDDMPATNIPPKSVTHPMLRCIGNLPQHMKQFVYGCEYYEESLALGLQLGYKILFVYPDFFHIFDYAHLDVNEVKVFLFCTEDELIRQRYSMYFAKYIDGNTLSIVSNGTRAIGDLPGVVVEYGSYEMWKWFYDYSWSHYEIDYNRYPFSVPFFENKNFYDLGNVFSPTIVNTQIFNSILGNWGYANNMNMEDLIKAKAASSKNAFARKDSFDRQNLLLNQIANIHGIEQFIAQGVITENEYEDQFLPPLIISAPYNSLEMRKPIDISKMSSVDEKNKAEILNAVMNFNYTTNYTIDVDSKSIKNMNIVDFGVFQQQFVEPRMSFIDMVGLLHASIRFSPYVRLPILGKNINTELAFVGIKNVNTLVQSKKANQNIRKVMEKIGFKIAKTAFSPTCIKMLNKRSSQIVAMTDLPIEWTMNDNIPLAFTHDVCRLPETPITSLLAQYEEIIFQSYAIPKDIMKKTLVVFGNTDAEFVEQQKQVLKLSEDLGFTTKTCLSIKELESVLSDIRPELLIIDAHGDVDVKTRQSYLWFGEEKLTGDIIIDKRLSSRLIFLSACNTFTTCNTISTIANAFFQVGALSVTTSYMPVNIVEATRLYTRLLRLLSEAAVVPIHKNWLAFIAHLQRTSYIQALITEAKEDGFCKLNDQDMKELIHLITMSMISRQRKSIYNKLNNTNLAKKMGVNYQYIIPHYLMYSTLGRADLLRFEIYQEKKFAMNGIKNDNIC